MTSRHTFAELEPDRKHWWIFHDRDGSESYYETTLDTLHRFCALYGLPSVPWTYEPPAGAELITQEST